MTITRRWRALALAALLAALALVGTPADAEATPSTARALAQACSTTSTNGTVVRTVSGREYRLRVPAGITGSAPLMLVLGGWNATPTQTETDSQMSTFADTYGTIVAYPTGSTTGDPLSGFIGSGPGWKYWEASGPDLTYLRDVVTAISGEYCVNPAHVHAVGFSMGGMMAQRLACNAKDVFASTAAHSTNDIAATWAGGPPSAACPASPASFSLSCSASWVDPLTISGICPGVRPLWQARLGCTSSSTTNDTWGELTSYSCGTRAFLWRNWHAVHVFYHQWPANGPTTPSTGTEYRAELAVFFAFTPKP